MLSEIADKLREEGIEKGVTKTAKKMLEEDFEKDIISRITGLSIAEIEKL